eukprot:CAMPEP_0175166786 /NCGR_PEP_ID=MMETSP0087-20121206/27920_1 /TAXON_ID=136419 /ORGANISM="Unknown Unknown, Strain D1" /LENGTH=412 /DNA_ID=CAMNT_0016456483 /DNA_START=233 /DNA_END=1471 /DNA_ORIENTATION=-
MAGSVPPHGTYDLKFSQRHVFMAPSAEFVFAFQCYENCSPFDADGAGATISVKFEGGMDECGPPQGDAADTCESCKSRKGNVGRDCAWCANGSIDVKGLVDAPKGCWTGSHFYTSLFCVNKREVYNTCDGKYVWEGKPTPFDDASEDTELAKLIKVENLLTAKLRYYRTLHPDKAEGDNSKVQVYSAAARAGAKTYRELIKEKKLIGMQDKVKDAINAYLPDGVTVENVKNTACGMGFQASARIGSGSVKAMKYADVNAWNFASSGTKVAEVFKPWSYIGQYCFFRMPGDQGYQTGYVGVGVSAVWMNVTGTPAQPITCQNKARKQGDKWSNLEGNSCICEETGVNCGETPLAADLRKVLQGSTDKVPMPPITGATGEQDGENPTTSSSPTQSVSYLHIVGATLFAIVFSLW